MRSDQRPARGPEHDDRDATAGQILLVPQILVGRDVELEARRLSLFDERAGLELRPATFERGFNGMITEGATERNGRSLVEQDSQIASSRHGQTLARMFENGIDLLPCHARKPLEELNDRGAPLEVLEERAYGHTRGAEQPLPADLPLNPFNRGALTPVEHA